MKENAQWRVLSDEEMRLVVGGSTLGGSITQENIVQSLQKASAAGGLVNTAININIAPQININVGK